MATLFELDSDRCEKCGFDPCNCIGEVERRTCPGPTFEPPAAQPCRRAAPARDRSLHWDERINLDGLDQLLKLTLESFAREGEHLPVSVFDRLDLSMEYLRAGREIIDDRRKKHPDRMVV